MLKKIASLFKKAESPKTENVIELSKIDKHLNFMMREKLGFLNKTISEYVIQINGKKDKITHLLRVLHTKSLMNPNISRHEINIMEGNRENYIKKIAHCINDIEIPKNYLEAYEYCVQFPKQIEDLGKELQKNIMVLGHFFDSEVKNTHRELNNLQQTIVDLRLIFERNNVEELKDISTEIKRIKENLAKIKNIEAEIKEQESVLKTHEDKHTKLQERVDTILTGTDYRALQSFKEEKEKYEEEIKDHEKQLDEKFSSIETPLKKYFYKNPDKKIIKAYLDSRLNALLNDIDLEIMPVLQELPAALDDLGLKDKKKSSALESLHAITLEYLKDVQSKIKKLETDKQHAQAKITHNSASLNLSEQQYWITATEEKMHHHKSLISKLEKDIEKIHEQNKEIKNKIQQKLEKLLNEKVSIKDDLENTP
jgi:chromosome segregation ATPase